MGHTMSSYQAISFLLLAHFVLIAVTATEVTAPDGAEMADWLASFHAPPKSPDTAPEDSWQITEERYTDPSTESSLVALPQDVSENREDKRETQELEQVKRFYHHLKLRNPESAPDRLSHLAWMPPSAPDRPVKAAASMRTFTGSAPPKWAKTAENDLTQIPAPASAGGKSKTMAEWLARFRGESVPHTPPQLKAAASMQTFPGSAPPKWAKTAENDLTQISAPASAGGKSKTMAEWLARFRGESVPHTPPQ